MRTLVRFNPMAELRAMDRIFNESLSRFEEASALPLDVFEKDGNLVIRAAVPGIDPSELAITIENHVLTLAGESKDEQTTEESQVWRREVRFGKVARSVRLPEFADVENVTAEFKNGLVTVMVPRTPASQPRTIPVQVS